MKEAKTSKRSSHLDQKGAARMVDVGEKPVTHRIAEAEAHITMRLTTLKAILTGGAPKGDAFGAARIAGIMAAKKTAELIPLCHPLPINSVQVDFAGVFADRQAGMAGIKACRLCRPIGKNIPQKKGIVIRSRVSVDGKTGVEMEALTAVAVAALTIYDMCKSLDRGMVISNIHLVSKSGGRSGEFRWSKPR